MRDRRFALGRMSQVDLATKAGISAAYVGFIERGGRRVSHPIILAIAEALDLEPAALGIDDRIRKNTLTSSEVGLIYDFRRMQPEDQCLLLNSAARFAEMAALIGKHND